MDNKQLKDPMHFFSEEERETMEFRSILKSHEEKIYIILSVIDDDNNSGVFDVCLGRTACYKKIAWLLETYEDYDVDKSVILVETRATNIRANKEEYFMNNYSTAASVYSFCKQVESNYEDTDYFIEIEDYRRSSSDEGSERIPNTSGRSIGFDGVPKGVNKEAYDLYNEVMKDLESQSKI